MKYFTVYYSQLNCCGDQFETKTQVVQAETIELAKKKFNNHVESLKVSKDKNWLTDSMSHAKHCIETDVLK